MRFATVAGALLSLNLVFGAEPFSTNNIPIVRMFVPGFTVREIPVQVTALNNIEYAPDGRLFAGGYDGRFHLLRDTDGDGLEDKLDTFSSGKSDDYPLGVVVKDGMPHYLLSDEIVRFRDKDGDGIPESRETVLKGWDDPNLRTNSLILHRRVDSAMGLAAGPDGSWYITMGSANPANGYWQDQTAKNWDPATPKAGQAHYATNVLRGCLLHLTSDGRIENLASGLRYIMALQSNQEGDLFGTDQEGATWLPNGNPFDEFLHIIPGRHYGFPPRHPVLLPNVVDEPSLWNYSPQHQSACGFRFNGPAPGRGRFGPAHWAHDAFVTGASRGKLWRTSLVRTSIGYSAHTELIASLGMMAVDCAISPQGDLVLACHAGPPDWGNGPAAMGRLFKVTYSDPKPPHPLLTWAAGETETIVEFDKALPENWKPNVSVEAGRFVNAGDRFERFRPGYAVVKMQQAEPRNSVRVLSAQRGENPRLLQIKSAARSEGVNYSLSIPDVRSESTIELGHDLGGVSAEWADARGEKKWSGWLPTPDLATARGFLANSSTPERLGRHLKYKGKLTLKFQLDLWNFLTPALQPGATLDHSSPPERITVHFESDADLRVQVGEGDLEKVAQNRYALRITPREGPWVSVTLTLDSPASILNVYANTAIDARPRVLQLSRFLMPFARPPGPLHLVRSIPEIAGGDWERGRTLFKEKASCNLCHQIRGEGFAVGPDLSNLKDRDYASVLRDITDPSATINPDAISYTVTLQDGTDFSGVRFGEDENELTLAAAGGVLTKIQKSKIASRQPGKLSMMPTGLLENLDSTEVKDLMTFLLTERNR